MDNPPKALKWGITTILGLAIAFFALPILAKMALDAVTIVFCLLLIAGVVIFLPALGEWAAQGAMWLKEQAWKTNPTIKLRRDWADFNDEIKEVETNIGEVAAAVKGSERDLRENMADMDRNSIQGWQENIDALKEGVNSLVGTRDDMKQRSNEMDREIRQLEAEWKMGKSLGKAVKSLNRAGQIAEGTQGSRVSVDTIRSKLDKSMAELQVIRSRKPEDWKKLRPKVPVIDVETRAISNDPSPTIGSITNAVRANTSQLEEVRNKVRN